MAPFGTTSPGPTEGPPHKRGRTLRLVLLFVLVAAAGCEAIPRDPESTLERARGGVLRVGVTEAPPWLTRSADGVPGGLEAGIVRGFAERIDADVEWAWGPPEEHLEALERFELDLAAGGLTAGSPWKSRVGLSRPYAREEWRVGVPTGADPPEEFDGVSVVVPAAGPAAAWVRAKGARPVRARDLSAARGPVAAPLWKLRDLGFRPTDHVLHTTRRVLAVPPGENGLLTELERYVHDLRGKATGAP